MHGNSFVLKKENVEIGEQNGKSDIVNYDLDEKLRKHQKIFKWIHNMQVMTTCIFNDLPIVMSAASVHLSSRTLDTEQRYDP